MHIFFKFQPLKGGGFHMVIIIFHAVLSALFRLIERNIRLFDQLLNGISVLRETHNTHTHGTVIIGSL